MLRLPHPALAPLLLGLLLLLPACTVVERGGGLPPALDGPALAIAGEQGARLFTGRMERACMLGQGEMKLESGALVCSGAIASLPNQSGHVGGVLQCGGGGALMLSFRNLGPDQGIGIGRVVAPDGKTEAEPLIFYYHPWDEEARRRLAQEKPTMLEIIARKKEG